MPAAPWPGGIGEGEDDDVAARPAKQGVGLRADPDRHGAAEVARPGGRTGGTGEFAHLRQHPAARLRPGVLGEVCRQDRVRVEVVGLQALEAGAASS
ncbi:MAG TPA: hypothetical protein PKH97_09430 [Tetrasphaera sp.]|nr:hypothetical protein [Tetrasphaera sp.]